MSALEEESGASNQAEVRSKKRCCSWGDGWKMLAWLGVMLAYLFFGGLIFMLAERPNEVDTVNEVVAQRRELASLLQERREEVMAALNATNMLSREAGEMIAAVINASSSLALVSQELQGETSPLWTFSPAIFFSVTVVTTIGYGNTAPVTTLGRVLFIFYAVIGIPIFLVFLSLVGKKLENDLNRIAKYVTKKLETRQTKHRTVIEGFVSVSLIILGVVLFIISPSLVFSAIEDWTFVEAVYYCFVTLTTVGFGDFVPAQASSTDVHAFYRVLCAVWIMFGLAWVALIITKIQSSLETIGPRIKTKIRSVKEKRRQSVQSDTNGTAAMDTIEDKDTDI